MKRLAIAAVLCLAAFATSATENGQWRATVAAAFSDFEGDSSFPVDDSTIGLQIMGQYQFNSWLGAELDAAANSAGGPRIATADSRIGLWVVPTDEELMIARHTRALLAGASATRAAGRA